MATAPATRRPAPLRLICAIAGGAGRLVLLLAVLALAATFLPTLAGYERYVLEGGSMEPTIHRGSLVFDEVVPVAELRRGDVITFVPAGGRRPVTHRIHVQMVVVLVCDENGVDPRQVGQRNRRRIKAPRADAQRRHPLGEHRVQQQA